MSNAFIKQEDTRSLNEIPPSLRALMEFLTHVNGRPIFEKTGYYDEERGKEFHVMTDGLTYFTNEAGHWSIFSE